MPDDFRKKLQDFKKKVYRRTNAVVNGVVAEAFRSVVLGSEITSAPGQPVDTGNLRSSWQILWETAERALIVTKVVYAPQIEDGTREGRLLVLRSQVGGFHSVKLTVAAYKLLVAHVLDEVSRA